MKIRKDQDRYVCITALNIAAFLFAKGEQIAGVNPTDIKGQKEFVFIRTDRLDELAEIYKFGDNNDSELLVSIRLIEQARRQLLDRLNDADKL